MEPADGLVNAEGVYCFAENGKIFAVYHPAGINRLSIDLTGVEGDFEISWFDPRNLGELQKGNIVMVNGGKAVDLGIPPSDSEKDWVVLVQHQNK